MGARSAGGAGAVVVKQTLIALDQLINAIFAGWADETISARAYRLHAKKTRWHVTMHVIDAVFFWQTRHCMQSYVAEQKRRHLPPEYRDDIEDALRD